MNRTETQLDAVPTEGPTIVPGALPGVLHGAVQSGGGSTKKGAAGDHRVREKELEALTDKWKRALADAENARKRADAAHLDGRAHGIALAVDTVAPAFDAICRAIETAQQGPDADTPAIAAHLEGLEAIRATFEIGLKALGVRTIAPKDTFFDPQFHEAMQLKETDSVAAGQVLILHRPGFALGQRLIRPAHVTVSVAPRNDAGEAPGKATDE